MIASRGMGAIAPSKQPKKIQRKDGASVDVYADGGPIGLYASINKRRKEGLPPKKPGQKGYPTAEAFKRSAKTARK